MNDTVRDKIHDFFRDQDEATYSKGAIIIFANQEPRGVSLLLKGVVEQYTITPEGNKQTVNLFKPPAFFPMAWAINRTPNDYFFAALSDVTLQRAPADETVQFLRDNPDVLLDLLGRVYKGTDALLKRLVLAVSGLASKRLIYELLIEAYRFGTESNERHRAISIKQSQLAATSGLARETVSRELHRLEREGLVTLTHPGIVLDIQGLERELDLDK